MKTSNFIAFIQASDYFGIPIKGKRARFQLKKIIELVLGKNSRFFNWDRARLPLMGIPK